MQAVLQTEVFFCLMCMVLIDFGPEMRYSMVLEECGMEVSHEQSRIVRRVSSDAP